MAGYTRKEVAGYTQGVEATRKEVRAYMLGGGGLNHRVKDLDSGRRPGRTGLS